MPAAARRVMVEGLYRLHQADGWEMLSPCFDERWYLDSRWRSRWSGSRGATGGPGGRRAEAEDRIATHDRLNAELVLSGSSYRLFEPGYDSCQRYANFLSTGKTPGGNAYTLTRLHPRKPDRLQNM